MTLFRILNCKGKIGNNIWKTYTRKTLIAEDKNLTAVKIKAVFIILPGED